MAPDAPELDLITVIVQAKDERPVIDAAIAAGAPGATYFYGRGTGVRQTLGMLGWLIEAEKVVVLLAVPRDKTKAVVAAIVKAAELEKPGKGLLVVHKGDTVVGMS